MRIEYCNRHTTLYALFIVLFLCLNPRLLPLIDGAGYLFLAQLIVLVFISLDIRSKSWRDNRQLSAYGWLCFIYACFIALIGSIYAISFFGLDADLAVNAEGWLASKALSHVLIFNFLYLSFPFMLLGQYVLLQHVDLVLVIRWVTIIWLSSACVIFYQKFIDPLFFSMPIRWMWSERFSGLSSDPNAFALLSFLMMGLILIGLKIEKIKLLRIFYLFLLLVVIISEWFTGNRTSAVGLIMFVMAIPFVFSISCSDWKMKKRVLVGLLPLAPLFIAILLSPILFDVIHESGRTGERLIYTWTHFSQGGFYGLFAGDARGSLFQIAWLLCIASIWSGWGPGGFYREYSNIMYEQTGEIHKAFDSPLNHYLMIANDFGLPVLIMNLIILLFPLFIGMQFLRKVKSVNERFVVATLLCSNIIFLLMINTMPPSYFLEVMFAWTMQLAILLTLGVRYHVFSLNLSGRIVKGILLGFSVLLIIVLIQAGDIAMSFGERVYQ